jgi:hypothetical protein
MELPFGFDRAGEKAFLVEHDLFRKPASAFRGHALGGARRKRPSGGISFKLLMERRL